MDSKGMTATALKQPIERWLDLVRSSVGPDQVEGLKAIYREHPPTQGELIFTGDCEFACQHCIYHPQYAKHNGKMTVDQWGRILRDLNQGLGINTFVYGGRSVTKDGLAVLRDLRAMVLDAHIGLIDNGISMAPLREEVAALGLDWIDISLDGLGYDHDLLRGRKGSFREGLEGAIWLKECAAAPKVNILTCLTTINRNSVIPMIKEVNALGFKNFFVTPVTIVKGHRPDSGLMLSGSAFIDFIGELEDALETLSDAWIELNIFAAEYMSFILDHSPGLWKRFRAKRESLNWGQTRNGNELFIRYYPSSLTGVREFIVNTNGDAIFPKMMAKGHIPEQGIIGSLLENSAVDLVKQLPDAAGFEFYYNEFVHERHTMEVMTWPEQTADR